MRIQFIIWATNHPELVFENCIKRLLTKHTPGLALIGHFFFNNKTPGAISMYSNSTSSRRRTPGVCDRNLFIAINPRTIILALGINVLICRGDTVSGSRENYHMRDE